MLQWLGDQMGVPADALVLFAGILLGFPISMVYRTHVFKRPKETQLMYFAACGIFVMLLACGLNIWHSLMDVAVAYVLVTYMAGTEASIGIAFVFFLGHLLIGYWAHETAEYDMTWTTPHCILTLRMIGLVFDVYDGTKDDNKLRPAFKDTALKVKPTVLELLAYAYFPTACIGGPQFPLNRLRAFIDGHMNDPKTGKPRDALKPMIFRLVPAIVYLVVHILGHAQYPNSYLTSDEFLERSFWMRLVDVFIWFRFILARYMSVWLIIESTNILSGFAYNSKTDRFNGLRDFHISHYELGSNFQSMVDGFNYNTNQWVGRYVFRRLAFLGNKLLSHIATLMFLAVWHGYHLGYFVLFLFEFACILSEQQAWSLVGRFEGAQQWFMRPPGSYIRWAFGRVVLYLATMTGFLTFGMVKKERWWITIKSMYLYPYVIWFVLWPLAYQLLRTAIPKPKPAKTHSSVSLENVVGHEKKEF